MMIGATASARVTRNRWPSSITCSSELGIRQASRRMLISGISGSSSPASTSVGWLILCSQWMLVQPRPANSCQ
ncbi:hypothetical protein D3C84_1188380 [compost metagenome]